MYTKTLEDHTARVFVCVCVCTETLKAPTVCVGTETLDGPTVCVCTETMEYSVTVHTQ